MREDQVAEDLGVTRLTFQAGETIFDEGEDPEAAYMIASGKVENPIRRSRQQPPHIGGAGQGPGVRRARPV